MVPYNKMPKKVAAFFRTQLRAAGKLGLKVNPEWRAAGSWDVNYSGTGFAGARKVSIQLSWSFQVDHPTGCPHAMFYIHKVGAPTTSEGCVLRVDMLHSGRLRDIFPNRLADLILLGHLL